jgi:uncharacterized membrane protein YoaK (UPF0700 family)
MVMVRGPLSLLVPADDRHERPLVGVLVVLTFLTGVVDAVSYLRLGHVFVANMTGNVVFLGFALSGAAGLSIASSLVALASFMAGAVLAGRLGQRLGGHRGHLVRAGVGVKAVLVAAALLVSIAAAAPATGVSRYAITVLLALAMGVQNSIAGRLAVAELTTTVLTKTLTGLASDRAGGKPHMRARRVTAVAAMLAGALVGGLLTLKVSIPSALALAAVLACAVVMRAHLDSRRNAAWVRPERST